MHNLPLPLKKKKKPNMQKTVIKMSRVSETRLFNREANRLCGFRQRLLISVVQFAKDQEKEEEEEESFEMTSNDKRLIIRHSPLVISIRTLRSCDVKLSSTWRFHSCAKSQERKTALRVIPSCETADSRWKGTRLMSRKMWCAANETRGKETFVVENTQTHF